MNHISTKLEPMAFVLSRWLGWGGGGGRYFTVIAANYESIMPTI